MKPHAHARWDVLLLRAKKYGNGAVGNRRKPALLRIDDHWWCIMPCHASMDGYVLGMAPRMELAAARASRECYLMFGRGI